MDERLSGAVENAYEVFARAKLGSRLIVCRCRLCFSGNERSAQVERRLMGSPLREIRAEDICDLAESGHGWHDQTRYFLPRVLELLANDEPAHRSGNQFALSRLGNVAWRREWPETERRALELFFETWFAAEVAAPPVGAHTSAEMILVCASQAGASIHSCLDRLNRHGDRVAAHHAAAIVNLIVPRLWAPRLRWFGWRRAEDATREIVAWLRRPELSERFEAFFFAADDPAEQESFSDAVRWLGEPDLIGKLAGVDAET